MAKTYNRNKAYVQTKHVINKGEKIGEFRYIIKDEIGIHARPAGLLVKLAKGAGCAVTITKSNKTVDATKIMSIMSLGVKTGDEVLYITS